MAQLNTRRGYTKWDATLTLAVCISIESWTFRQNGATEWGLKTLSCCKPMNPMKIQTQFGLVLTGATYLLQCGTTVHNMSQHYIRNNMDSNQPSPNGTRKNYGSVSTCTARLASRDPGGIGHGAPWPTPAPLHIHMTWKVMDHSVDWIRK